MQNVYFWLVQPRHPHCDLPVTAGVSDDPGRAHDEAARHLRAAYPPPCDATVFEASYDPATQQHGFTGRGWVALVLDDGVLCWLDPGPLVRCSCLSQCAAS